MRSIDPAHPGTIIRALYITPPKINIRKVAIGLCVSPSILNRLLNGENTVSPKMALRLAKCFKRSPESWLAMQDQYDLWHVKKRVDLKSVKKLDVSLA